MFLSHLLFVSIDDDVRCGKEMNLIPSFIREEIEYLQTLLLHAMWDEENIHDVKNVLTIISECLMSSRWNFYTSSCISERWAVGWWEKCLSIFIHCKSSSKHILCDSCLITQLLFSQQIHLKNSFTWYLITNTDLSWTWHL